MVKKMGCYKVKVKTTNPTNKTSKTHFDGDAKGEYFDCENGFIYVVTDNPAKIYEKFTPETVISIENIGIGYCLNNEIKFKIKLDS